MLALQEERDGLNTADTVEIGPLTLLRLDKDEAVGLVRSAVAARRPLDIAICNAHTILTALDDPDYAATLQAMTLLNDGMGTNIASRLLQGTAFPENLNGTDFVPELLERIGVPLRIYLLGAHETQVKLAKAHIEKAYPMHQVAGYRNGYFGPQDIPEVCAAINAARPDLLLVAMGNPRQECFIVDNRERIEATVAIGVGALFDFLSGSVARAPRFLQKLGLEWLFRMLQEPKRLARRYLIGIPRFLVKILQLRRQGRNVR